MTDLPYIIRNYCPGDSADFARASMAAGRSTSAAAAAEQVVRPNFSPERDLFIAERSGEVVGYLEVTSELGIGRVVLEGWVAPEHRRRGLATELVGRALGRARELGARVAHTMVMESNEAARSLLSRQGFSPVRRFLDMKVAVAGVSLVDMARAADECRSFHPGDEGELTRIQNLAFAEHWGYHPNTVAEITYKTRRSGCSPEDIVLTGDEGGAVGFSWIRLVPGSGSGSYCEGRIYMVGVDPAGRGRGVGRRLLLASLAYLKDKGMKTAGLFVDSENEVACALYRSLGFDVQASALWYEKVID